MIINTPIERKFTLDDLKRSESLPIEYSSKSLTERLFCIVSAKRPANRRTNINVADVEIKSEINRAILDRERLTK